MRSNHYECIVVINSSSWHSHITTSSYATRVYGLGTSVTRPTK